MSPLPSRRSSDSSSQSSEVANDISEAPSLSWAYISQINQNRQQLIQGQSMKPQQVEQNLDLVHDEDHSSAVNGSESSILSDYENAEHALLSYSRTNKLEELQSLLRAKLENRVNLNLNFKGQQKQNYSWSALHLACYFGNIQVVKLLLSERRFREEIDINIQNNSGDTPLHKATLTNRAQIVQLLLSQNANVFVKNCDGLLAKQLTSDRYILNMLEAAERVDKNRTVQAMFKAVDNGDLKKLQEYFESYDLYMDASMTGGESLNNTIIQTVGSENHHQSNRVGESLNHSDLISRMTDGRGNTLLHVAAMRGFKGICVYLLEQGLDPYKKNHLGQSSIDLSSYQLRQLFTTVKPANTQLKKLSSQRVTRFEGPLLKKVRILGWRQIYVVLENGVILLFNNRRDSMNKSRRGYKYLESATCEPEASDLGTFTVSFSDKSRATFLISPNHLNNYTSFKSSSTDQDKNFNVTNQIELIRQKWIDSISDHIRYSTEFIKNGLKFNDDDSDTYDNGGDLTTLNHLLPLDTIKSFMQEARAHYSILERHADELCKLVQTIASSDRTKQSESYHEDNVQNPDQTQTISSTTMSVSTGNRLLNFIRPNRQNRVNSITSDDNVQLPISGACKKRNDSLTNEFLQDNWHCILFHLRLLVESTENTKVSMGQALGLIEHQEQLRQNRIQDQEERCRVLEDSLHALARDHHELEKSLSMSQIYHSAAAGRTLSMSMSTDLNEYFDAFEDFDDANSRTLTPTSMPTEDDINQRLMDVMNEGGLDLNQSGLNHRSCNDIVNRGETTDDDDDDLQSNCSALTVATTSDQSIATLDANLINAGLESENHLAMGNTSRTRLPAPMVPRDQVSIWSILKNCIGKELSKITMPVVFNEPLTMLQRACEGIQYSQYLMMADDSDDPVERLELICAFIIAGLSANCHRIIKPFNPLLYETYEYTHELENGTHVNVLSQQVSHHPPITACHAESDNFIYNGSVNPKIKFWGRSIEIHPDGQCRIYLKRHKETYVFKTVSCSVHNIIVGKLWFEHRGPMSISCVETNMQANLDFKKAGWFSNDLHRFDGIISQGKNKYKFVYGKWSDYMKSVDYSDYEKYMRENQQKLFKIPDKPDNGETNGINSRLQDLTLSQSSSSTINNNCLAGAEQQGDATNEGSTESSKTAIKKLGKSESTQSLDIPNSRTIWRLESQYLEEYYNFTLFTMKLNELTPKLAKSLPRTDSRFRLDVRKLEEGDLDGAANEKQRLEEKQREVRSRDERFKNPSPDLLWFDLKDVHSTKEKFWIYKGGYWESKCNSDKFPDLF